MAKRYVFPAIEETILKNGLKVILVADREQDGLVVALQMPFGRFADAAGSEGCSELCIGLMQKGTHSRTSEQFTELFEHHGASLFADVGEEHAMLGVKMLSGFRDILFPAFWEMITAPLLDEKEFKRLQQEMVTGLRAESIDPGSIANRHFYQELAGSGHPAGRHHSVFTLRKITAHDVREFFTAHVSPNDAVLVIAGNITSEWFVKSGLPLVDGWVNDKKYSCCEALEAPDKPKAVRFIEKNDLTQVSMVIGQAAPGELHPDRHRIALANYVFGAGNFSSRLMTRIRSSAGNTYSITSHIAAERRFGSLTIATSTQNRQLTEVLNAILQEYSRFCSEGITAKELDDVKKFASGNMAFQLEGLTNLVEKLLWLSFYQRSRDYIERFDEMIGDITLDSVNDAVTRCFNPEKLIFIGVGKATEVLAQLEKFGKVSRYHYKDRL